MTRHVSILTSREVREKLCDWIMRLPVGTRVELKEKKRSTDQNSMLWSMLSQLSVQMKYHGMKLKAEDWKLLMLDALFEEKRERMNLVPSLSGRSVVPLGRSSSDLTVSEMSDLIELIHAYGAENGIVFNSPKEQAA